MIGSDICIPDTDILEIGGLERNTWVHVRGGDGGSQHASLRAEAALYQFTYMTKCPIAPEILARMGSTR